MIVYFPVVFDSLVLVSEVASDFTFSLSTIQSSQYSYPQFASLSTVGLPLNVAPEDRQIGHLKLNIN